MASTTHGTPMSSNCFNCFSAMFVQLNCFIEYYVLKLAPKFSIQVACKLANCIDQHFAKR